jgi:hypothetical protein
MNFTFDDIYIAIKNKIIDITMQQIISIIIKNKNNFSIAEPKTFIADDLDEKYIINKLGKDIRIVEDYNSGSGDYVVLAKNKLFWINLEHNEISDINYLPFGSIFDNYDAKVIKYIVENYKNK